MRARSTPFDNISRRGREPPNKQDVEERIAEAQRNLLSAPAPTPTPPPAEPPPKVEPAPETKKPEPPPAETPVTAAPAPQRSPLLRRAGIALTAIGAGVVIVGSAMAGLAASSARQIEQAPRGPFDPSLQSIEASGVRYEQAAIGTFVGGGVVAAVGVVLLAISLKR
jgi:outer membrane biosynthesis protein TonB